MVILKGAEVSAKIKEEVQGLLGRLNGQIPRLAIVRVGEKPDDLSYERGAMKKLASFGLEAQSYAFQKISAMNNFKKNLKKSMKTQM